MNDDPDNQRIREQPSENMPVSSDPEFRPAPPADATPPNPDSRIQGESIRLFRVAGIDVMLHWSWFVFAVLRLQPSRFDDSFGFAHYESQVWYAVEYLALFGIVLLHEFGHVLGCRWVGGTANRIVLWPLGGIASVDPPPRQGALLWSIAAGPLVNVLLLVPTIGFWLICRATGCQVTAPDFYRFAESLAWINGSLLLFNLLPISPLDGGRILQALLWFIMSRARSLLVTNAIGLLTASGLLIVAIIERTLTWGIMAGIGVLFSLIGFQGARSLNRSLNGPRWEEAACPACGSSPPKGNQWLCEGCSISFDVFAAGGNCPNCSRHLAEVLCHECGGTPPYLKWYPEGSRLEPVDRAPTPVLTQSSPDTRTTSTAPPTTVAQRVLWGTIFAFFALCCCGLPSIEEQPLGLIVWTAGGAMLGATRAGALSKIWSKGQAHKKLRGKWRLVEEDGRVILDNETESRHLILNLPLYEERVGGRRAMQGSCWTDPLTESPSISFTPKTGPDAGKPRQGIYRLEGEILNVCLACSGHPRPIAFDAQPEVQQMRIYRRGGKRKSTR